MREVAKKFWLNKNAYPNYGTTKQRRLHEINYLVPKLQGCSTLLDLGCGDGSLIRCLSSLTDIEKYYGYDLSPKIDFIQDNVEIVNYDCYNAKDLPFSDVTIMAGLTIYLFEDEIVNNVLSKIESPMLFLRDPCTLLEEDEYINKYVEKLDGQYSAKYRTVRSLCNLIEQYFDIDSIDRVYPDNLEQTSTTRQYYFKCKRK